MFCPECGTQLEDGKNHCSKCDWYLKEDSIISQENISYTSIPDDTENSSADVSTSLPSTKTKSNSLKFIIPIAAIITVVLAVLIGITTHYNSDGYKIKKASELIAAGNYSEGVNKISDIYTPQAITIKAFVNVEYAKQAFISSASSDNFEKYKSAYYDFYNEISSFEEENEIFYLPDNLRQHYEQFRAALDFGNDYIEGDMLYENLRDAQMVMLNMVDVKTSTEDNIFTIETLQGRIDTSEKALAALSKYDFTYIEIDDNNVASICYTSELSVDSSFKTVVYLRESLPGIINAMISLCKSEIESSNEFVETLLTKWETDDVLYWKNPETSYFSYVGSDLDKIYSEDNIYTNANTITHLIKMDITYYLLVGTASPLYY